MKRLRQQLSITLVFVLCLTVFSACVSNSGGTGDATTQAAVTTGASATTGASSAPVASTETGEEEAPAAATEGEGNFNELGTFPIVKEMEEFTIMMPQDNDKDPGQSWMTEQYEAMSNVHINWIVIPQDGWKDRKAITFAGGDLPDVIAGMDTYNLTPTEELQYASQGLILPLKDIVENNSIHFKGILDENPSYLKLISQDDGDFYSIPTVSICYHCNFSQKMFINSTWLDNLGLSMPATTDEFYQTLKAFKEQDANKNGDPDDEIPLISNVSGWHVDLDGFLMCAFIYSDPDTKMAVENGEVIFTPVQEKYREGLRYLNMLYSEGLISPESFTNDEATNAKMNVAGMTDPKAWETAAAVIGAYPYAYQNNRGDTDIWKQYEILPPVKGPDGFVTTPNYALTRDVIRGNLCITKDAANPALIMRWLDWRFSEEGEDFRRGREGIEWRAAEPGELDFNGEQAVFAGLSTPEDDPYYGNIDWSQTIPILSSKRGRESSVVAQDFRDPDITNGTEIQLFHGTRPYEAVARSVEESLPGLSVAADKISDYSRIKTEIDTYAKESVVKFITGTMSLDADWESYKTQLANIGLDEYMSMSNEAYQNYLNR